MVALSQQAWEHGSINFCRPESRGSLGDHDQPKCRALFDIFTAGNCDKLAAVKAAVRWPRRRRDAFSLTPPGNNQIMSQLIEEQRALL